jgi:hypothetical protein
MSLRFRNLKVKEWVRLFGPFVLAFFVGLFLRSQYILISFRFETVHALGDALMVAGIIGTLLELFSAKFLIERVSDDLSERLVGRGLPKELQAHIREITNTRLVWSNYVKRYNLSLSTDVREKMQLDIEITSDVRNYSEIAESYAAGNMEEAFYAPKFLHIEYGLNDEPPKVFNEQKLLALTEIVAATGVKKTTDLPKIDVPPFEKGKFAKILHRYQMTMPLEYTDLTHFGGATTDVSVVLQSIPDGFEFSAEGEGVVHAEGSNSWAFKGPFVKGHHVRVRWFKRPGRPILSAPISN